MNILIYLLLVVINYYCMRSWDKYVDEVYRKIKWIWEWNNIIITLCFSTIPIFGLFIAIISDIHYIIKLPKNPPKWL